MGVYYLHKESGDIIFIGKGNNVKNEVNIQFLKTSKRSKKIQEKTLSISHEPTGNELITNLKYYLELEVNKPKYNLNSYKKLTTDHFNHPNMILVDKGRVLGEHSVILIEEDTVIGYAFTNLAFQENQIEMLKTIITPIENKALAKTIVKNYLRSKKVLKIIRF